jgi:hypothetical protein
LIDGPQLTDSLRCRLEAKQPSLVFPAEAPSADYFLALPKLS